VTENERGAYPRRGRAPLDQAHGGGAATRSTSTNGGQGSPRPAPFHRSPFARSCDTTAVPKASPRREHWKHEPEEHDFSAAEAYLSLSFADAVASSIAEALRGATTTHRKAKDMLRAAHLGLLPQTDPEVAKDLKKVARGEDLSPVLLVRGTPLVVADGYHRICASYHLGEDTDIPCRLVDPA
jgi:hypothetical protein